MLQRDKDTICAVSTPQGHGGISVIRVSGPRALDVSRALCRFLPKNPESHKAYFGTLTTKDQQVEIDEVLALPFLGSKSFTGEEVVEISCHGNPILVQWILKELVTSGARLAERGEFTYRAFMNGKLDLVQAESVLSMIESQTQQSAQQSLRQLKGGLSEVVENIENELTWCLAHLEASIDFSQEGIEIVSSDELKLRLSKIKTSVDDLMKSYTAGRILREGLQIALAGVPNVGKSSLLNSLMGEEKAIVTDVPGTTRDLVEGAFILGGVRVLLSDTAGLREAQDKVEKIGIQKSLLRQKEADYILFAFDVSREFSEEEAKILEAYPTDKVFLIGNKLDLIGGDTQKATQILKKSPSLSNFFSRIANPEQFFKERVFFVSTFDKKSVDSLRNALSKHVEMSQIEDQTLIMQTRHFENLVKVEALIRAARELVSQDSSAEFIALELKQALILIQEILGKRFDDQIMDRVFKEFCIGK
ncbi:MAG: tRNA modification GTPase MnmE [Oligoflexia bacterium]|nr:MAG: tRNA modification GTPase MnmE [Oligoflexia bacterium]